ncbi:TIGR01210 family radical SAM protein [Halobacteriales archaeon QS_9_70_65]|nr:MAG: TIGR01210 family radical SAM protein [Halobacteriales archaeon QS_9_70_65]
MSQPTPDVYEEGRGMDAHNEVMREVRSRNDRSHDPTEPTRVWLDEDNTPDGVRDSLTIILNTGGCRWARAGGCTMCGYVAESVDGGSVDHEKLMTQLEACLDHERENADEPAGLVKIYTSGSFLDEREIPPETREAVAETFADRDRLVVESLPDFVDREKLREFTDRGLATDVAVGLETATDRVRHDCVNKYFDFADFEAACAEVRAAGEGSEAAAERASGRSERRERRHASRAAGAERPPPNGRAASSRVKRARARQSEALPATDESRERAPAGVKAYLLLKPPFLAEPEAVADMVQRHTMVEELYHDGGYRPPWLWSVCEVLEATADADAIVVSDPVGHGSDRGPHNCGDCDDRVQTAIKDFDLRQDPSVFEEVACDCEATWEHVMCEETAYNQPLVR